MQKGTRIHNMAECAMIAALYAALCLALAPLSFGVIQVRAAEALTLLPVFSPTAVWGVTFGCALANLVGFMTGANILGFADVFFGTAATLAAALCTRGLRDIRTGGLPVLSALPPVLINAFVIGGELSILTVGSLAPKPFLINAAYVGAGQLISCLALGLPMVHLLQKSGLAGRLFASR